MATTEGQEQGHSNLELKKSAAEPKTNALHPNMCIDCGARNRGDQWKSSPITVYYYIDTGYDPNLVNSLRKRCAQCHLNYVVYVFCPTHRTEKRKNTEN